MGDELDGDGAFHDEEDAGVVSDSSQGVVDSE